MLILEQILHYEFPSLFKKAITTIPFNMSFRVLYQEELIESAKQLKILQYKKVSTYDSKTILKNQPIKNLKGTRKHNTLETKYKK